MYLYFNEAWFTLFTVVSVAPIHPILNEYLNIKDDNNVIYEIPTIPLAI